jgi:molybdenum cofactor synthesis domain-containing protein
MGKVEKIRAVAITISDRCSRGEAEDVSGAVLLECLSEIGAEVIGKIIVSDDFAALVEVLKSQAERAEVNIIVTTGGTGFAPRDNTPEATRAVIEREANGLSEAMRFESLQKTPTAMLSRAVCGIRGTTLIINLPGSPKAVRECFDVIKTVLPHAVNLLSGNTQH